MSVNPNFTNANPTTSYFAASGSGGGGGSNTFSTLMVQQITGLSTMSNTLYTTTSNTVVRPIRFDFQPDQALKGGAVEMVLNWDAADTGANVACVVGANSSTAYIGSQWLGFITAPMSIYGAVVDIVSDNETFLHMDGKAGAQGSISTGVEFIGCINTLSTLKSPDGASVANMNLLLSTLKGTYPACFS